MNYAVRITYGAEKLGSWFSRLAQVSERVCVYEHSEHVSQTHCHVCLYGYQGDVKNIKRWAEEALNLTIDRTKISVKSQYKPKGTVKSIPIDEGAISYASKGKYEPKYVKGFSNEEVNELKAKGFDKKDKPVKLEGDMDWYHQFEVAFMAQSKVATDEVCFYDLRAFAVSWNFMKLQVVNQNYKNKVKMCVQTFMMAYGTKIPEKDKDALKKYADF